MPLMTCSIKGQAGWKWGDSGTCYPGDTGKRSAIKQGLAEGHGSLKYEEISEVADIDEFYDAYLEFRDISTDQRKALSKKGHAMPDGSFPIANTSDLRNAIHAIGRASNPAAVKAFIKKRAKELGAESMLPPDWKKFDAEDLVRIENVGIFSSGIHNGDKYSESDLEQMVSNFKALDFRPPIKQGHTPDIPGLPALGYLENLRRDGKTLIADLVDMPKVVADAIKRKSYDNRSLEVYPSLNRGGKTYKNAIKAMALLGADIPGVANLTPLSSLFDEISDDFRSYIIDGDDDMDEKVKQQIADLEAKVNKYEADLTKKTLENETETKDLKEALSTAQATIKLLSEQSRQASIKASVEKCVIPAFRPMLTGIYEFAMDAEKVETVKEFAVDDNTKLKPVALVDRLVADINEKGAKLFAEVANTDNTRKSGNELDNPGDEVDRLAREYSLQHKVEYVVAVENVLNENPELKAAYAAAAN